MSSALPPLHVDVTRWSDVEEAVVPIPAEIEPYVRRLYSMLRRPVDEKPLQAHAYDAVLRPGVGIPVGLGRGLRRLLADFKTPAPGRLRVAVVLLDLATWNAASATVRPLVEQLTSIKDDDVQVIVVSLHKNWDKH